MAIERRIIYVGPMNTPVTQEVEVPDPPEKNNAAVKKKAAAKKKK